MPLAKKQSANDPDLILRDHLVALLNGGNAHVTFDEAVKGFPAQLRGVRPEGLPYSAWELLEHIRIAQSDILQFSRDAKHVSPDWPTGYWPQSPEPGSEQAWEDSVEHVRNDLEAMVELVQDLKTDLYGRIPWGTGQTILREALLAADHNAYHVGELVALRRLLGCWNS